MDLSFITVALTQTDLKLRKLRPEEQPVAASVSSSTTARSTVTTTTTSSLTDTCQQQHQCCLSSESLSPQSSPSVSLSTCLERRMSPYDRCQPRTHIKPSKHCWPWGLRMALAILLLLTCTASPSYGSLDITAFEYVRKFNKNLDLGECPMREIAYDLGNNITHYEQVKCSMRQYGRITHLPRETNDSRNAIISSPEEIVPYLGLCGGEAASFLGILHFNDCFAVEMASYLTFNKRTMIRAYVGFHRTSVDILDSNESSNDAMEGFQQYLKDKFYLKSRTYGTLEIILVQFRFQSVREAKLAKAIGLATNAPMTAYMAEVKKQVGEPKQTKIISLSTGGKGYQFRDYKSGEWERAFRHVEILELDVQRVLHDIKNGKKHHLQYQFFPFEDHQIKSFRSTSPIPWEKISMLEVQLNQSIQVAKKASRQCRGFKIKVCRRVRELKRNLSATLAEIHQRRTDWVRLSTEEKSSLATQYTARIKTLGSVTKKLAKDVRIVTKPRRLERRKKKKEERRNKVNQIPTYRRARIENRQRPVRHSRHRNKVRKG